MVVRPGSYSQRSGSLARAWAERPVAVISMPVVSRLSGGTTFHAQRGPVGVRALAEGAGGVPASAAVADPGDRPVIQFGRRVTHLVHRVAGVHVHHGAAPAVVQAQGFAASVIPSRPGSAAASGGAAVGYPGRPGPARGGRAPACPPRFGQVTGGRGGDAAAGQVQAGAQRGELPGHRAGRGQRRPPAGPR